MLLSAVAGGDGLASLTHHTQALHQIGVLLTESVHRQTVDLTSLSDFVRFPRFGEAATRQLPGGILLPLSDAVAQVKGLFDAGLLLAHTENLDSLLFKGGDNFGCLALRLLREYRQHAVEIDVLT